MMCQCTSFESIGLDLEAFRTLNILAVLLHLALCVDPVYMISITSLFKQLYSSHV